MEPRVAATNDNNFAIGWSRYINTNSGSLDDIFYTLRNSSGGQVKPVTQLTSDTPGSSDGYDAPNLVQLSGNRVLFTMHRFSNWSVYYAVLDSMGNIVKGQTPTNIYGSSPDAVQLSGGNIVIAMSSSYDISYVVLDNSYNLISGSNYLSSPAAISGNDFVSVTADQANHAILTWSDADWYNPRNLYYALVGADGSILTPPMIFLVSRAQEPYLNTSYSGYGNASYSWLAAFGVDGIATFNSTTFNAPRSGLAAIGIQYTNRGGTPGRGVNLTITLDPGLTYLSDSSGLTPQVIGNQVIWELPDLYYLDRGSLILSVGVPSDDYGTSYPLSLNLTTDGPEAKPEDNIDNADVSIAHGTYLTKIFKR